MATQTMDAKPTVGFSGKPPCAIFDLDGCLAIAQPGLRMDWDDTDTCNRDLSARPPNIAMLAFIRHFLGYSRGAGLVTIIVMTGRPEKYRQITLNWLSQYGATPHDLWMRGDNDTRSDAEVKRTHLHSLRQIYDIWFTVEDRTKVVQMWRSEGVTCLQCAEGNY